MFSLVINLCNSAKWIFFHCAISICAIFAIYILLLKTLSNQYIKAFFFISEILLLKHALDTM